MKNVSFDKLISLLFDSLQFYGNSSTTYNICKILNLKNKAMKILLGNLIKFRKNN
jgi:hypothetical protein